MSLFSAFCGRGRVRRVVSPVARDRPARGRGGLRRVAPRLQPHVLGGGQRPARLRPQRLLRRGATFWPCVGRGGRGGAPARLFLTRSSPPASAPRTTRSWASGDRVRAFAVATRPASCARLQRSWPAAWPSASACCRTSTFRSARASDPVLDWGNPEGLASLIAVVTRRDFWDRRFLEGPADLVPITADFLHWFVLEIGLAGVGLALVARGRAVKDRRGLSSCRARGAGQPGRLASTARAATSSSAPTPSRPT